MYSIAVTTEGKKCLIDSDAKQKLIPLLFDENSEVKLNAIKVCSSLTVITWAHVTTSYAGSDYDSWSTHC